MTLGKADKQGDLLDDVARFCDEVLPENSIYTFLRRERDQLFPDEEFADLFGDRGRCSVPPSVISVVMVLQRLGGLSDREAVDRYSFDSRWRYAAGVGGYDTGGWNSFSHTVLVDTRERLRRSARPNRIFEAALGAAGEAGLIGCKRVLDSTPLYDAVATMDTVTLIRSAIRGLLKVASDELEVELRGVLNSGDDYADSAKPQIDWDDKAAREALIDTRAKDAYACLAILDGRELDPFVDQAGRLLATVVGQDLEVGDDGIFRIARRVAKDRVISTVDPEARHGHKTASRHFDGYKGHAAIDPDSEIITETVVSAGNAGDASVAEELIADLLGGDEHQSDAAQQEATPSSQEPEVDSAKVVVVAGEDTSIDDEWINRDDNSDLVVDGEDDDEPATAVVAGEDDDEPATAVVAGEDDDEPATAVVAGEDDDEPATAVVAGEDTSIDDESINRDDNSDLVVDGEDDSTDHESFTDGVDNANRSTVYGDNAYGTGPFHQRLEDENIESKCKTQRPTTNGDLFTKDRFDIDLDNDTVTCPAGVRVNIARHHGGGGLANFAEHCDSCHLAERCTSSKTGRTISVGPFEAALARARDRQKDPAWMQDYRATRPKVERKLAHLMRRTHGGRRARVRGKDRVNADFKLLAGATNLARLAVLGVRSTSTGWEVAGA